MEPVALNANTVRHNEQTIDIAAELASIDQGSWEYSQIDSDQIITLN